VTGFVGRRDVHHDKVRAVRESADGRVPFRLVRGSAGAGRSRYRRSREPAEDADAAGDCYGTDESSVPARHGSRGRRVACPWPQSQI